MTARPEVSVIIPTHDRPEAVFRLLASLAHQSSASFETIVVDDGSTPALAIGEIPGVAVRLVRTEGIERSRARNLGVTHARAPLLLFLDDDLTMGSDFIRRHVEAHERWPDALVVGKIRLDDSLIRAPFGRFRQELENAGMPAANGPVTHQNFCTAANMSVFAARFRVLGGFDPGIISAEDQDLALRHTATGGSIVYIAEAEAVHHDTARDIRAYCRRVEWGSEQLLPFFERHRNLPANAERERVNGPIRVGIDGFRSAARKVIKDVLMRYPLRAMMFALTRTLERVVPDSRALDRVYRILIGMHIRHGFMRGWQRERNAGVAIDMRIGSQTGVANGQ